MNTAVKILLPLFFYLSPINKITYSKTGGRGGNTEALEITKTSIKFVQGHGGDEKTIKEKSNAGNWNKLTRSVNLSDFGKIKSDPGHAMWDGIDVTITILAGSQEYTIVNGSQDTSNYKKISPFINQLNLVLERMRKKIVWK